jgi:hypothetical protein
VRRGATFGLPDFYDLVSFLTRLCKGPVRIINTLRIEVFAPCLGEPQDMVRGRVRKAARQMDKEKMVDIWIYG